MSESEDEPTISDEEMERILDAFAGMTMRERLDTLPRYGSDDEYVKFGDVEMMLDRELSADASSKRKKG